MNHLLKDQTAIITGGTAGIGKAIALKFAQQGSSLAIFGTNHERGKEVIDELQKNYPAQRFSFHAVDVANTNAVDEAVKKILADYGHIDILINNAGITIDQLLLKMSEEDWDQVIDVNVKSCFNLCKSLVRSLLKAKKGKIINVSSVVGLSGNAGQVNYAASKAAVIGFTKALAKELASRNICVNCIAPGFIQTRMTDLLNEEQKKQLLTNIPLGRFGNPEEIANAALFLASPLSDYITGQVLTVDGGMVMA